MDIKDIKTGDCLLTTDYKAFLSKSIVKVMNHWKKKQKIVCTEATLSHAGTFAWIAGELYVYGSIESGYKPWLFKVHYSFDNVNEGDIVMRRVTPLTPEEENIVINYVQHLITISISYQFWNFIQWIMLVYFNVDWFKKDSDDFTYCYESQHLVRKHLNPDKYGDTYKTSYFDLVNDPNYSVIFRHEKSYSK
jgi:hypothetical protein